MRRNLGNIILFELILTFSVIINSFSQENPITKEQLSQMNNIKMSVYTDTCNRNNGLSFKILIIGNSITRHEISEKIGWSHVSGMAASNIEKDYAHILYKEIEGIMPENKICMRISNLASFERNFQTYDFRTLDSLVAFKPDLVIFQLGENTSFDSTKTPLDFEKKYIELINYIKNNENPIVICTTPFFPSQEKNDIIARVVNQTNSFIVDLSQLVLKDKTNYAKNELDYPGDQSTWKVGGIGIHPGDFGMRNIAMQIFLELKIILNNN